jgi:Ca2+-binding RTX toxin-like protein
MAKVKLLNGEPLVTPTTVLHHHAVYEGVMQPPQATSVTLLNPDGQKIVFKGSFIIDNGVVTGGTVTGFTVSYGSMKVMKGKGYAIAWADLEAAIAEAKTSSSESLDKLLFAGAKIKGTDGDDYLFGSEGSKLLGGDGDDTLIASVSGPGSALRGGDGDDLLIAQAAAKLVGGEGDDVFAVSTFAWNSRIADFDVDDDVIAVYPGLVAGVPVGPLADSYFNVGKAAETPDHHFIYNRKSGVFYIDLDGAGGAAQVQYAQLDTKLKMTADNIMVADFL